jgi:hypothetical protein
MMATEAAHLTRGDGPFGLPVLAGFPPSFTPSVWMPDRRRNKENE